MMDAATIEKVAEKVGKLDLADHILAWDRKQSAMITIAETNEETGETSYRTVPNPDARRCQANKAHGLLAIHKAGNALMCCVARPHACDYSEPVSR